MTLLDKIRLSRKFGKAMMIPTFICVKLVSIPVIYYLRTLMERGFGMYFYLNLGISKREYMLIPSVVEFLAFVMLMVITGIIGYAIG